MAFYFDPLILTTINVVIYGAVTRTYAKTHPSCQTGHCIQPCFPTLWICHHFLNKSCVRDELFLIMFLLTCMVFFLLFWPRMCGDGECKLTGSSQYEIKRFCVMTLAHYWFLWSKSTIIKSQSNLR
jgi:hypothetical protein